MGSGFQVIVEVIEETSILEVYLQGSSQAPLSFPLPPGVTEEHLQASSHPSHLLVAATPQKMHAPSWLDIHAVMHASIA